MNGEVVTSGETLPLEELKQKLEKNKINMEKSQRQRENRKEEKQKREKKTHTGRCEIDVGWKQIAISLSPWGMINNCELTEHPMKCTHSKGERETNGKDDMALLTAHSQIHWLKIISKTKIKTHSSPVGNVEIDK